MLDIYVQKYPKDTSKYSYAYITLSYVGSFVRSLLPFHKLVYQVVDEYAEVAIYESGRYGGIYTYVGRSEYDKTINYLIQNGWEQDGTVYSRLENDNLPRVRRPKG